MSDPDPIAKPRLSFGTSMIKTQELTTWSYKSALLKSSALARGPSPMAGKHRTEMTASGLWKRFMAEASPARLPVPNLLWAQMNTGHNKDYIVNEVGAEARNIITAG